MKIKTLVAGIAIALNLYGCADDGFAPDSSSDDNITVTNLLSAVPLNATTMQPTVLGTGVGYTMSPFDIRYHYNIPDSLTGAGTTIVIVTAPGSGDIASDLKVFNAKYNLPPCNFQKIDLAPKNAYIDPRNDWAIEIALDVEWAHAVAPRAKIVLVTAASSSLTDMMAALKVAVAQPGTVAVSMSWGALEFFSETTPLYDGFFARYPNIAFFAASGDDGNNGKNQMWPAASPYVTAVGGTTITKLGPVSQTNETSWGRGGGGASIYESMPFYQTNQLSTQPQLKLSSGKRAIPDVAYNADGKLSPVAVYTKNNWYAVGGTSAGAPQWAGIASLLAQNMQAKGKSFNQTLSFNNGFNNMLYQAKLDKGLKPGIFDIIFGNNNTGSTPCALCNATSGYDAVTGLGVPNVGNMLTYF